jgi:ferredoxin-like protein FixX
MNEIKVNKRKLVTVNPAPGEHIRHDKDRCTQCGKCVMICSMALWQNKQGKVQLAEDYKQYCLECASCFQVCDAQAVRFEFPEAGYGIAYAHG